MRRIETFYPIQMVLFLSLWFNLSLGGGKSSDQKPFTSLGSYKTLAISASPEYSAKYKTPSKGDPAEMAYEFFQLNEEFFQIKNPREELVLKDKNSNMAFFQQVYHGIELLHSAIIARFSRDGELKSVEGNYIYDISLPTTPSIDSASSVRIALQESGPLPRPKAACPSKPVIIPSSELFRYKENRLYMAWQVRVYPDSTEKAVIGYFSKYYRYYIDALDGSVLQKGEDSDLKREPLKPTKLKN